MERYFKILGIPSTASMEEIKQAYYSKLKALHPDKVHGTVLEDTANFLSAEINEAYNFLIEHFDENDPSINTPKYTGCIEEDIYIKDYGYLRYFLSNDLEMILNTICIQIGGKINLVDGTDWRLNSKLSANVKNAMIKNNVEYSMTIISRNIAKEFIINRRVGDRWFSWELNEVKSDYSDDVSLCFEQEIFVEGTNRILLYSLSNDLDQIEKAIYARTYYNVDLKNINWKKNIGLSMSVKELMNKHGRKYSMTTVLYDEYKEIIINKRVGDEWFIAGFREINGSLYEREDLQKLKDNIETQNYKDDYYHHSDSEEPENSSMAKVGCFLGVINIINVCIFFANRESIFSSSNDGMIIAFVWFIITVVIAITGFFVSKSGHAKGEEGAGIAGMALNGLIILPAILLFIGAILDSSKKKNR